MLARGALCRLAVDLPKTSTHDLPRISQLLRTNLFARHGASQPTVGAIARAFRATILESRRAYATKSATEPTARVKREVKKAVAKKPAKKTTTTTKTKKAAPKKRNTAAKTKAAPKKSVRRPKKVLTAEEKEAAKIKALKKTALRSPLRPRENAWTVFVSEALKGSKNLADSQGIMKEAGAKYKNFTPAEREHYNQIAKQNAEAKIAEYNKWIHSHTPEEIRAANRARTALKRKLGLKNVSGARYGKLIDDRPGASGKKSPYILFAAERLNSGEFSGIAGPERLKLVGAEWKALNASEKKKYEDQSAA
ncbi:uncharacterized protein N0V89_006237 [Didymosphaeria variabile]|uniref:HMG box domain-containing protein n=1 Tax=Didymosphaeria variabile TaxID=1932322 RepID=A0A9W9CC13_9PLEO|nr:uncharacterized protein N0V89_006237 [Didymosphaeria variabile]KAJ4354500.1 hypothetical protein N0V89_006237 [Didymosphaeria variabile]